MSHSWAHEYVSTDVDNVANYYQNAINPQQIHGETCIWGLFFLNKSSMSHSWTHKCASTDHGQRRQLRIKRPWTHSKYMTKHWIYIRLRGPFFFKQTPMSHSWAQKYASTDDGKCYQACNKRPWTHNKYMTHDETLTIHTFSEQRYLNLS